MTPRFPPRPILLRVIAYIAFISLGLPDTVNGVSWPSVRNTFQLPQAALGAIVALSTISYLISSLLTPRAMQRLGIGTLLTGCTALVATGLLGYSLAPLWWLFLLCALLNGTGSGAIDTSLNAYAAKRFSLRSMNWLHGFYMVGAGLGPGIMTAVLAQPLSWRAGYAILSAILATLALLFLITRRHWEDSPTPEQLQAMQDHPPPSISEAIQSRPLILQALLFFLQTAMEVTTGLWCYTYMVEQRGVPPALAGTFTTLYWCVFAGGRFLLGATSHHMGPTALVRFGSLTATIGAVLFATGSAHVSPLALACIGLGLAPVFPTLMSCTPERLGPRLSNIAVGVQVSASALGGALMPGVAGLLATTFGLTALPLLIISLGLLLWLAHEALVAGSRSTA